MKDQEPTNPLREEADKKNIVELRAENTARENYLAQYDAKVTIQETIAHAVLAHSTVGTSALVENTLAKGPIHVDTLARETAEDMTHFAKLDEKPFSVQLDAQWERRRQLDRYEESIALREMAVNKLRQILNQGASADGDSQEPATEPTPKA